MLDRNDHREIGRRLDLFHFQDEAPGMVFWHDRGYATYRALEGAIRRHARKDGFVEVRTPELLRLPVWQASGHLDHYEKNMFLVEAQGAALKPVSCPGHLEIVRRRAPSYRDLPLRYAEFGVVHRNEPSGTLHGLFRLRQFTQDDGHVFCAERDIEQEVARFASSLLELYVAFGFADVRVVFASRPDDRAGTDESWDRAERWLWNAARTAGLAPEHTPKAGAFYGPKLEFSLQDRLGRSWQCGTIQLDLLLPERFDVFYVDSSGARQRPVMLHRATLGSLERFLGMLLEQHAGNLPLWLSPEQVTVLPVDEAAQSAAEAALAALRRADLRARLDARAESLARRISAAHEAAVPFLVVVGPREAAQGAVTLQRRNERKLLPVADAVSELQSLCAAPV